MFQNLIKDTNPQPKKFSKPQAEQILATTKETPKRIMAKLLKNVNKEEISKVVKKKKKKTYYILGKMKGNGNEISSLIMKTRCQMDTVRTLKEKAVNLNFVLDKNIPQKWRKNNDICRETRAKRSLYQSMLKSSLDQRIMNE